MRVMCVAIRRLTAANEGETIAIPEGRGSSIRELFGPDQFYRRSLRAQRSGWFPVG